MLEARFPRVPGEVGNALTFDFPVHYEVIPDASPQRVVRRAAEGLLPAFIEGARRLVARGADGITTNCGFLSLYQEEIAAAVELPVMSSSLMQVGMVQALLPPGQRVGVLTISKATLTAAHLEKARVPADTPITGTREDCHFNQVILGDRLELDTERARADLIEAGRRLVEEHANIGAVVLECTNMCPYSADLARDLGLPVFDMAGFIRWFQAGLSPQHWETLRHSGGGEPRTRP